jgi:predicted  nucleic acid-binding Zn-ribbon protein
MIRRVETDLEDLRARVEALEAENAELRRRTEAAVASSRRQADALDEAGLDLNELMRKPGAKEFRALVRATRGVYRLVRWEAPKWLRDRRSAARIRKI